jgi:hypothetical protein
MPSTPLLVRYADHLHHGLRRFAQDGPGYEGLTKPFGDDVLLGVIRHALERSKAVLDQEAEMAVLRECYASLTGREREVMALPVSGLLNKQVGGSECAPRPGDAKDESRVARSTW